MQNHIHRNLMLLINKPVNKDQLREAENEAFINSCPLYKC